MSYRQDGGLPGPASSVRLDGMILASALDSAGLAVIITDLELEKPGPIIRYVNSVFEDMTGYAAEEVIGRSPRLLQGPETNQDMLRQLKRSLQEHDYFSGEAINYRKSGEPYRVQWIITPILDENGTPTHWMALLRPIP